MKNSGEREDDEGIKKNWYLAVVPMHGVYADADVGICR
jgi:hypothetical protein